MSELIGPDFGFKNMYVCVWCGYVVIRKETYMKNVGLPEHEFWSSVLAVTAFTHW